MRVRERQTRRAFRRRLDMSHPPTAVQAEAVCVHRPWVSNRPPGLVNHRLLSHPRGRVRSRARPRRRHHSPRSSVNPRRCVHLCRVRGLSRRHPRLFSPRLLSHPCAYVPSRARPRRLRHSPRNSVKPRPDLSLPRCRKGVGPPQRAPVLPAWAATPHSRTGATHRRPCTATIRLLRTCQAAVSRDANLRARSIVCESLRASLSAVFLHIVVAPIRIRRLLRFTFY